MQKYTSKSVCKDRMCVNRAVLVVPDRTNRKVGGSGGGGGGGVERRVV